MWDMAVSLACVRTLHLAEGRSATARTCMKNGGSAQRAAEQWMLRVGGGRFAARTLHHTTHF